MNFTVDMNSLLSLIRRELKRPIVRYFIMASVIVTIELLVFAGMNSWLKISYLIATPVSNIVAIVLNWYFSRTLVFAGKSKHKKHIELGLVFMVSLVGIGLQLIVTAIAVEDFKLVPILGKIGAIFITFFWNYWARNKYIFTKNDEQTI
jgi:putative flippase GtrA